MEKMANNKPGSTKTNIPALNTGIKSGMTMVNPNRTKAQGGVPSSNMPKIPNPNKDNGNKGNK